MICIITLVTVVNTGLKRQSFPDYTFLDYIDECEPTKGMLSRGIASSDGSIIRLPAPIVFTALFNEEGDQEVEGAIRCLLEKTSLLYLEEFTDDIITATIENTKTIEEKTYETDMGVFRLYYDQNLSGANQYATISIQMMHLVK